MTSTDYQLRLWTYKQKRFSVLSYLNVFSADCKFVIPVMFICLHVDVITYSLDYFISRVWCKGNTHVTSNAKLVCICGYIFNYYYCLTRNVDLFSDIRIARHHKTKMPWPLCERSYNLGWLLTPIYIHLTSTHTFIGNSSLV